VTNQACDNPAAGLGLACPPQAWPGRGFGVESRRRKLQLSRNPHGQFGLRDRLAIRNIIEMGAHGSTLNGGEHRTRRIFLVKIVNEMVHPATDHILATLKLVEEVMTTRSIEAAKA
jgi:hypothetical protein